MIQFTILDIAVLVVLTVSVPLLVNRYLKSPQFSSGVQLLVILGGLIWLGFAFFTELTSKQLLDLEMWDAIGHRAWALKLVPSMSMGDWQPFLDHFRVGNRAYQCYVALVHWMGASVYTVTMINGMLCFWAGLLLVRHFSNICPFSRRSKVWVFVTIFFPSVVFWGTMNLKEGPMYWAICCVLSAAFVFERERFFLRSPLVLPAVVVGGLLRPHVMFGWVIAVAAVNVFQTGRRGFALLLLMSLPLLYAGTALQTGLALSTDSPLDTLEERFEALNVEAQRSHIHYLMGKPIFFVSGFISAMLRPFPWHVRSTRMFLSWIETWTLTLALAAVWLKYGRTFGRLSLQLPSIRAAILGCLWMCVLLSYFPNEGLVFRQRVQMVPGLLTLIVVPLLLEETVRQRLEYRRRILRRTFCQVE